MSESQTEDGRVEKAGQNFSEFCNPDWFVDRSKGIFWARFYSIIGLPAQFISEIERFHCQEFDHNGWPIRLFIRHVFELKAFRFETHVLSSVEGDVFIKMDGSEFTLPTSSYVFLVAPASTGNVEGPISDSRVRSVLDEFAAVSRMILGHNTLRNMVFEGAFWAGTGNWAQATGPIIRRPEPFEGPFLSPLNWSSLVDIERALKSAPVDLRRVLCLSLKFINQGIEKESFLDYWMAFEVICGGPANTIRHALANCYGIKKQHDAESAFGLSVLKRWRHEYVHNGMRPPMTTEVERLLRLILYDLLRWRLGLRAHSHAIQYLQAAPVDLSCIGLGDRRPHEEANTSVGSGEDHKSNADSNLDDASRAPSERDRAEQLAQRAAFWAAHIEAWKMQNADDRHGG